MSITKVQEIATNTIFYTVLIHSMNEDDYALMSKDIEERMSVDNIQYDVQLLCTLLQQYGRLGDIDQVRYLHSKHKTQQVGVFLGDVC